MVDKAKLIDNAVQLGKSESSTRIMLQSLQLFGIKRKNYGRLVFFIIIETLAAIIMSKNINTISQCETIIGIFLNIFVSIFAVIFTGYSLYQALLNKELLIFMLSFSPNGNSEKDKSYVEESNRSFVEFMMALFTVIVLDIIIRVFLSIIPDTWCMFTSNTLNEVISSILIIMIMYLNMEVLWETKSFIFNVYTLFNAYTMAKVLEYIKDNQDC